MLSPDIEIGGTHIEDSIPPCEIPELVFFNNINTKILIHKKHIENISASPNLVNDLPLININKQN